MNFPYRLIGCFFLVFSFAIQTRAQEKFDLLSPNGQLKVSISLGEQLTYTLSGSNKELLTNNRLALDVNGTVLGKNPQLRSAKKSKVNDQG